MDACAAEAARVAAEEAEAARDAAERAEVMALYGPALAEQEAMVANGTNARSRAHRARQLGWAPKHDIQSLWASLNPEAEAILKGTSAASAA